MERHAPQREAARPQAGAGSGGVAPTVLPHNHERGRTDVRTVVGVGGAEQVPGRRDGDVLDGGPQARQELLGLLGRVAPLHQDRLPAAAQQAAAFSRTEARAVFGEEKGREVDSAFNFSGHVRETNYFFLNMEHFVNLPSSSRRGHANLCGSNGSTCAAEASTELSLNMHTSAFLSLNLLKPGLKVTIQGLSFPLACDQFAADQLLLWYKEK